MAEVRTTQIVPATLPSGEKVAFFVGTFEGQAGALVAPGGLVLVTGAADARVFTVVGDTTPLPVKAPGPLNSAITSVGQSAVNVPLLAARADRKGLVIYNNSPIADLFVKYGPTASAASFTHKLTPFEAIERQPCWPGQIDGIWSAGGAAQALVTETW